MLAASLEVRMRCVRLLVAAGFAITAALLVAAPVPAREVVAMEGGSAGQIIIRTQERHLYFVLGDGRAIRYPVGVGREGMQWSGRSHVDGKYIKPAWRPPAIVRRENPAIADYFPGGASNNPMGAAALTLEGGDYAIHGTNRPSSVGRFVSHGCIRMYNADVLDLYRRVSLGTPVLVTQ
jgi:lipoprotein-anchoring transpeptidase ErfK/SrfK